jgi:hypothetical protein
MLQILLVNCLASLGSALTYRLGGIGKPWGTKWRDLGVPLFICIALPYHWSLFLCFLLSFGSMTTYWKDDADCSFANWLCTGYFYTIAFLPYFWLTNNMLNYAYCLVTIPILTAIWSDQIDLDWLEEGGRGFILCYLILLFAK